MSPICAIRKKSSNAMVGLVRSYMLDAVENLLIGKLHVGYAADGEALASSGNDKSTHGFTRPLFPKLV